MNTTSLIQILLAALVLGAVGTFLVRGFARRMGVVEALDVRKIHLEPVPLLGGLAIYLAFIGSLILLVDPFYVPQLVSILLGASLISFLGLWDDRRSLSPALKMAGQVVITLGLILTGVQVNLFDGVALDLFITAFWILGITNAFNLLDNMDGLSSGVGAIAAAFFLMLAIVSGQYLVGSLAAALLGACLGFLLFNFNPASIFMGDAGSLFLGFMMAVVGLKLRFLEHVYWVTWMIPILVLGVPIFDTVLVTVSRIRRGVPVWQGGKDHLSHRLATLGWSTRRVVAFVYALAVLFGLSAVLVLYVQPAEAYLLGGLVLLLAGLGLWRMEFLFKKQAAGV